MYYVIMFSTFDVIALVIQSIGGAGAAQGEQDGTSTTNSTHIMVSSITKFDCRKRESYAKQLATSHFQSPPSPSGVEPLNHPAP
jgi:hypothetical protein